MKSVVLSTAYLGPIPYYQEIAGADKIFIEQYDHYHKQTYRNRCTLLAANGPISLSVPVIKASGTKTLVKDMLVDQATRWQQVHWRSICSAYNSSPFFEYYRDDFEPLFHKNWKYLIDLNASLMQLVFDALQWVKPVVELTSDYLHHWNDADDYRDYFSPKKKADSKDAALKYYTQTFAGVSDFVPGLSIIDLLYNMGPRANDIIR